MGHVKEDFFKANDQDLLSMAAAGEVLGRSRSSIYRHFTNHDLHPIRVGHSIRVTVAEVRKLLQQGATA